MIKIHKTAINQVIRRLLETQVALMLKTKDIVKSVAGLPFVLITGTKNIVESVMGLPFVLITSRKGIVENVVGLHCAKMNGVRLQHEISMKDIVCLAL